ncbi:adenosine-specific kinase [Ensifer canadensis]
MEDRHEAQVGAVPGVRFGLAFCGAAGKRLARCSGNDEAVLRSALTDARERENFLRAQLNPIHEVNEFTLAQSASVTAFASMNSKQRKILAAVFKNPVSGTTEWAAIENLLVVAGANVFERNGSRVKFEKDGIIASFNR